MLYHTHLTHRQLKHSLTVLIQQHVVLWYTSSDESTQYEANYPAAYTLIRSGNYVKVAKEKFGDYAGAVITNLLLLGHARVGDLLQTCEESNLEALGAVGEQACVPTGNRQSVGLKNSDMKMAKVINHTSGSFRFALQDLLQAGVVMMVHESHFRSIADNRDEAENEVSRIDNFMDLSRKETKLEYEATVQRKLEEWRDGPSHNDLATSGSMFSKKRRLQDIEESHAVSNGKRPRMSNVQTNGANGIHHPESDRGSTGVYIDVCIGGSLCQQDVR